MSARGEARKMRWDSMTNRHLRGLYAAMDDMMQELERAQRLVSFDATDMDRSLITTSAATLTTAAASFAEHAYALDVLREIRLPMINVTRENDR